jgi:transcriptional regulator GlxA family with amidase domain
MAERPPPVRVGVVGFDGCLSSAVVGLLDAFNFANRWTTEGALTSTPTGRFDVRILGALTKVAGSSGLVFASEPFVEADPVDIAIIPPTIHDPAISVAANGAILEFVSSQAAAGRMAASVCGGAFFLAGAGLLAGRRATTNPLFAAAFQRAHPDTTLVLERRLVDEGNVLTAGSTTAFLDLAVYLVERFAGHTLAVLTAKALNIDKNHRSQLPYFLPFADKGHGDAAVSGVQSWLEDHFAESVSIERMARRAALSQRSLNRRFLSATGRTPLEYLHRLRIEAAKRHLETSKLNVQEITSRVGYEDARSFSRLFRSLTGQSPAQYRLRFGELESEP